MEPVASCKGDQRRGGPVPVVRGLILSMSFLIGLGTLGPLGCGPSDERIASWRRDPDGVAKLLAAVKDRSLAPSRRGHAAAVLVEMGAGVEMESTLAGFDLAERAAVAPYLIPRLAAWLDLPDPGKSGDARDALSALREQSPNEEARKSIDAVLLPALIKDVRAGRERAGRSLIKNILIDIGAPVVPLLTPLLQDPAVPFATPVEVIDKVGDLPAKEAAASALTRRARGLPVMPEGLWPALATLGGKDAADFLGKAVEKGTMPDAELAAKALLSLRRTPGVGPFAVRMAEAESTADSVRELMFQVAEKDGGEETGKALVALFGSARASKNRPLRKRTFAALLKTPPNGKQILPALEALPLSYRWDPQELRDDILDVLAARPGFETRRPYMQALESKSPIARLVGVLGLEKMGFYEDFKKVEKLVADPGTVKGLPASSGVGAQARRVTAALRKLAPPGAIEKTR
jgi:hypothetical protein